VAPVISDSVRIPKWYSLTVGIFCCSWLTVIVVALNGSAVGRGIFSALFAIVVAGSFWASRVAFRRAIARPLPRRGLGRWLVSLPGWLMVLVYLAYWLVLLGLIAVVSMLFGTGGPEGFLIGAGPLVVITALGQGVGWLELRQRLSLPSAHTGHQPHARPQAPS
jgi:hypothetical protein